MAACNPPGLTLEVAIDDPGIKSVELFLGKHCDGDCPRATVPPGLSSMAIDDAYIVDDPAPFKMVDTDFTDGVAGFRIETDHDTTLDILVVVGYDGQGVIKWSRTFGGVPVSHSDTSRWRVELEPTTPITPMFQVQPAGTERIARWAQPSASTPACLLIEHWSDAPTPNRDLVVPDADHDCDGVAVANECAPWIPNATGAIPTIDAASCVLNSSDIGGGTICVLGGPQCTEDPSMQRDSCVPLDASYCTPSVLCQCAAQADQTACLRTQVADGTSGTGVMPYLKCVITVDASGNRCDDAQIEIDGGPYLFNSRKCTSMGIADGELPVGPFGDILPLGAAKLKLTNFVEPCKVDVEWAAGLAPALSFAVLDLALDNKNHLAVPARIEVKPGCSGTTTSGCVLVNNNTSDAMFACVQATTPASCLPDSDHGCAGPYCNGTCCGFGEACVNGTCQCGGQSTCVGGNSCQSGLPNETQCGSVCCGAIGPCPV